MKLKNSFLSTLRNCCICMQHHLTFLSLTLMKAKNPMVFSFTLFAGALTAQSVQAADNTSQNIVCHEKLDNDVYDYLIFTPKEFKTEFEKLAR